MPYGNIYCVTNTINGKRYVGMTTQTIAARWRHHLKLARWGKGSTLHAAMRKHGTERFEVSALAVAQSQKEMIALECRFIEELNTLAENGRGYNRTKGGIGSQGAKATDATRRNMSDAQKRAWQSDEIRSSHRDGRVRSWDADRRAAKSAAMKGHQGAAVRLRRKPKSQSQKEAAGERFRRYWAAPEARYAASERVKKRFEDPEYRALAKARAKSLQSSEDYRAQMAETIRAKWRDPEFRERQRQARLRN